MTTIDLEKIESDTYKLFEKEFTAWVDKEGYVKQLRAQNMNNSDIMNELYDELTFEEWDYVYDDCLFKVAAKYDRNFVEDDLWSKFLKTLSRRDDWFYNAVEDVIYSVVRR